MTESPSESALSTREFLKIVWPCVKDLAHDDVFVLSSAIAFNALLSSFPFLILLLSACRSLFRWRAGYDAVLFLLREEYLPVGQEFIARNLNVLIGQSYGRIEFLSVVMLIFTASGVFIPVEMALNRAWRIKQGRGYLRRQALIMMLVVGCGVLALAGTALTALYTGLLSRFPSLSLSGGSLVPHLFANAILQAALLPITIAVFFIVYYFLPAERLPLKQVLQAAVFTGVFWEIMKYLFTWGQPLFGFGSVYGPFRITVTLVFWAYLSALLLLLGANLSARNVMTNALRLGRRARAR